MNRKGNKLMVVESSSALRESMAQMLTSAGYEVSAAGSADLEAILAFDPEVIIMGAEPVRLDCCDLLNDIKRSAKTKHIRVIMLAPGGAAERGRALDLGADDVLSVPFDEHELLARVRAHLREKHPEDELRERINVAETWQENALKVISAVNRQREALKAVLLALLAIAVLAAAAVAVVSRRVQKQTARVYAAVNQLQARVSSDEQTIKQVEEADADTTDSAAIKGKKPGSERSYKSEPATIATAKSAVSPDVTQQLKDADRRLQRLEAENRIAQDIIRSYSRSVCLIHVQVGFKERSTGRTLRYLEPSADDEQTNAPEVHSRLGLTGNFPEVRIEAFGTGFLISANGAILTNHHVINPWWQDPDIEQLMKQGLDPVVLGMTAYFPGVPRGITLHPVKTSSQADLALVSGDIQGLSLKPLVLEADPHGAVSGEPVILLGYPTALDAIMARADSNTQRSIAASATEHPDDLVKELAQRGLIRPVNTQGHIGDVLPDRIIYDAQTTLGGSGGPLFNAEGKVIGVNFAVLADFGGSNFAIPVRYARSLVNDGSGATREAQRTR